MLISPHLAQKASYLFDICGALKLCALSRFSHAQFFMTL